MSGKPVVLVLGLVLVAFTIVFLIYLRKTDEPKVENPTTVEEPVKIPDAPAPEAEP
jgi:hypothetical protein